MPELKESDILAAEERLRLAMLSSSVDELDALLADELLFTNHLGHLLSKEADLAAHRSSQLTISALSASEFQLRIDGALAVVSVRVALQGSYHGQPASGDFRFTRVWARRAGGALQVIAAHSGVVAP